MGKINQDQVSEALPSNTTGDDLQPLPRPKEPGNHTPANQKAPRKATRVQARVDKGRVHAAHNGLLSKHIVQALVRSGENPRNLRRYEKQFRDLFKPQGALGGLLFDRFWNCYLRLYLCAKLEARVLTPNHSRQCPPMFAELQGGELPILVSKSDPKEFKNSQNFDADDLFHELALAQRYDAHYGREAYRMTGMLLVMRKGGEKALERLVVEGIETAKNQRGKR